MIFWKILIGYIGLICLCSIFGIIKEDLAMKKFAKKIKKMSPKERYELLEETLLSLRNKAYQNQDYEKVDEISDLLEQNNKEEEIYDMLINKIKNHK